MKFSPEFIEKVRDANNIVEFVSQYSELKSSSVGQYVGLCPYPDHNEKSPSFSVSESKQVYYCFGCKKSGNIFSFLQDIKGMGFPEAVKFLAEKRGIDLPKESASPQQLNQASRIKKEKEQFKKINVFAARFFVERLRHQPESSEVKTYLSSRGFKAESIRSFGIGYAPDDWEALSQALQKANIPLALAETLGLVKRAKPGSKNKTGYFDTQRHRLIFPILSLAGDVVGFGGRIINPNDNPKYLNSPETPLFHKGKTLYGLFETAKFIRSADQVIVVEGYTDLIGLYDMGVKNVVATLGTALTSDHAKLIKRLTKNVVVLFDGDQAGQIAAERSLPILLGEGLHPKGLTLPSGADPDEYVKSHGSKELLRLVSGASELFYQVMSKAFENYRGGATEKVAIVDKMTPFLAPASDVRLKKLYFMELKERLGVDSKWLADAMGIQAKKPAIHPDHDESIKTQSNISDLQRYKLTKAPKVELYLLNLCLKNEKSLQSVLASDVLERFSHVQMRQIFLHIRDKYVQNPSEFDKLTAYLIMMIEPQDALHLQFKDELVLLSNEDEEKMVADCISRIKLSSYRKQQQELTQQLKGSSPDKQQQLLKELSELRLASLKISKEKN